ncbi:PF07598 family protein [Leptospira interrogans serovar Valbuzzi str. Duyster]|nr:PF07598 family protein [Leptospira interrogans serovar Valbuzzi str. Duyster]
MYGGSKYCYSPVFTKGEGYVWIDNCRDNTAKARYDVFQRISYNINNTWLCITAPETVVKGEETWNYVNLRPCTINDPLQRWIVKDNSFWTANGRYRLKDTNWYGYISRNSGDRYDHTLDSSMNDWIETIATPGNISIQTSIAWDLQTTKGNERYFIRWGSSNKNTTPLYYNPESGHIAQYDPSSGLLNCMYSKMIDKYDWNWVKWGKCSDAPIKKDNPAFWNVYFVANAGGMITDYKGNILRVTKEGPNWGVAYTAKPSYLEKDTTHSPTSVFTVDVDLLKWIRYTTSNLGKTDQYCPAGKKESRIYQRVKRNLPSDFQLSVAWVQRLYDIARSATFESANPGAIPQRHGACGVCLLHSFQMIAELMEYHSRDPLTSGGYFFNTASNRDPFLSFSQRYPELDRLVTNVPVDYANRGRVFAFASAMIMLPQYEWESSSPLTTRSDIQSHIRSLINSPPGSIWLGLLRRQRANGSISGHAVPILRTSEGLVVIPTNMPTASLNTYIQSLAPTMNPNEVINRLENGRTLTTLTTIRPVGTYENPFSLTVSSRDCTGDGDDRRGSGRYPISSLINQCSGGRCILQ